MSKHATLDRREFTRQSVLALFSGVAITLTTTSCGESPAAPSYTDVVGNVSNNHGHTVTVTAAQLSAAGDVTLEVQGTSSHPHQVTLSANDIRTIRSGARLSKDTTPSPSGSHFHTVTFN
jgi:hypothetical protein